MSVKTSKVEGRRELQFETIDDILTDAEQVIAQPHRTIGNWTAAQIIEHLAMTFERAATGTQFRPPLVIRVIAPLLKNRFLNKPMRPGFQMPQAMKPEFEPSSETEESDALAALRERIEQYKSATKLYPHSALGKLTRDQWDKLHMRHSEMHLSFILPAE